MKIYTSSYNGVLDEYKSQINYASPLDADKLVVWQDCSGSFKDLVTSCKRFFPKPIYTVQHGRRASRDYGAPLKKSFNSDKFLAWGKWDYDNMAQLGYKAEIVGCPLNTWIKPKVTHKEKVVLFLPVNSGKEEPDNILVYNELLKLKLSKTQEGIIKNYDTLKKNWNKNNITRHTLSDNFTIVAGNLPWHDQKFYTEGVIKCYQDSAKSQRILFDMIRNSDVVVSTDEGTAALFSIAHDVPVIVVDGFKYKWQECNEEIAVTKTPGIWHCDLDTLQEAVNFALSHPEKFREERRFIAENEMSLYSIPDPIKRLHEIISAD